MMDFKHLNDCEQMTSRCTKLAVQSFFEGGCLVTQGWECLYPCLALDGYFLCIQRVSGYAEGMGICRRDGQPSQERGLSVYPNIGFNPSWQAIAREGDEGLQGSACMRKHIQLILPYNASPPWSFNISQNQSISQRCTICAKHAGDGGLQLSVCVLNQYMRKLAAAIA